MTGMTDRRAFIGAIRANPEDDAPRLVYADWLDEYGEPERAEFIRTQIWLAKHVGKQPERPGYITRVDYPPDSTVPAKQAIERELVETVGIDRLLGAERFQWDFWSPEVQRGFVESLRLPAADWLTHAAAILAEHLVREVTLTTWPEIDSLYYAPSRHYEMRLIGGRRMSIYGQHHIQHATPDGRPANIIRQLLRDEWPGITFHLPEPAQHEDRGTYVAVGRIDPGQMVYFAGDPVDRRVSANPPNVQGRLNILAGAAGRPIPVPGVDQDYFVDGDYVPVRRPR